MENARAIGNRPALLVVVIAAVSLAACAGGTQSVTTPPPPPVTVTVQPGTATLFLGQTQQFAATVTGSSNTNVNWSVSGITGGNSTVGMISANGLYSAPATLPAPATLTITAASIADPVATGSAKVTLQDDIAVSVSPPSATVPAGGIQVFTATVTGSGSPAAGVTWAVNGIAGGNASIGSIVANGAGSAAYTAPVVPPSPPIVTISAISVADPAKIGTASVTITCANAISPATASVALAQTQTLTASLCAATGTPIIWDVNGVAGGNASLGTIVPSSTAPNEAVYTAPVDLPATNPVTIHATAGTQVASAAIAITSGVAVTVSPISATLAVTQRATFTANVANSPDTAVTWSVNGVPYGNPTVGEICVVASSPCVSPNGAVSGSVDYVAPTIAPAVDPVMLTATSEADPSKSGDASVLIAQQTGPVSVSVSPLYAFVAPSSAQPAQPSTMQFFATVTGSNITGVTWSLASAVSGQGCAGTACGTIDASGLYTAPTTAPSPNAISVIATSVADPTKTASSTVAITSGPTIRVLLPSSVMAGAVESFPLEVQGVNFVAGSGSSASVILLNGQPRSTTCATAGACTTVLNPADVQSAETATVQVQNPGSPGKLSNPVPFVIIPFDVSVGTISLGLAQPSATENLIVAEPTTAASSAPINVDFVGFLNGTTCGVQGSPLTITRPSSGTETLSLCVHGNGLDPTFTYAFTGPSGGSDIGVAASSVSGVFSNMIELDLTISSTTLPGVRSLFITTFNNDRAVATGMLEVK